MFANKTLTSFWTSPFKSNDFFTDGSNDSIDIISGFGFLARITFPRCTGIQRIYKRRAKIFNPDNTGCFFFSDIPRSQKKISPLIQNKLNFVYLLINICLTRRENYISKELCSIFLRHMSLTYCSQVPVSIYGARLTFDGRKFRA